MAVSLRNIAVGVGILFAAAGAVVATSASTAAGQTCCQPPSPPPPPPPPPCCQAPRNLIVNVPGVSVASANVHVGAVSSSVAVAGVSTSVSSGVAVGSAASGQTIIFGGGGGYVQQPSLQSTIRGLNVSGGLETRTVEEEVPTVENYCIDKVTETRVTRPVQAMCVDDRNVPHPASRMDEELKVDGRRSGEIFRCLAGSRMQVTLGHMVNGNASFEKGETFSCAKGQALWHVAGGKLECRAQTAERNCNERSLLRRYGPGVKLVEMASQTKICEPATRTRMTRVTRQVQVARPSIAGDLVLDGGVGN